MSEPTSFADQVKAWRARHDLTLEAGAKRLGVPYRTLQEWHTGRHEPRGLARRLILARLKR